MLNSRPLTYVGDQIIEPLTPSHLVIGKRLLSSNTHGDFDAEEEDQSRASLTKRQRFLQSRLEHFVRRWKNEYLTELRVHHNCHGRRRQPRVNVGDVVNIYEDKTPRQSWKVGVIDSILKGRDGSYRAAVVRTYNGDKVLNITRPLARSKCPSQTQGLRRRLLARLVLKPRRLQGESFLTLHLLRKLIKKLFMDFEHFELC